MSFALTEYLRSIPFQISSSAFAFFCLLSMLSRVKALSVFKQWRYFREIYCTFKFIFF